MFNRKALLSLVAVAAVSMAAALTVNSANAVPKGPGVIVNNPGKGGGGGAWPGKGPKGPGIIVPPGKGPGIVGPKWPGPKGSPIVIRPHWCFYHPWRCRTPILVGRYPVVTTAVAAPVAASCTCLTKQYLPDAVLFKDVCTQETAIQPAAQQAQAQ